MNKIVVLKKPVKYTSIDGKKVFYRRWGKFLEERWLGGKEYLFIPIFACLWPGLWLKSKEVRRVYWYEWPEYYAKMIKARINTFFHYQKLGVKSLIGK